MAHVKTRKPDWCD